MDEADNPAGVDAASFRRALTEIKAIHLAGGTQLTKAETVEFVTRPVWFGGLRKVKAKGVGRGPQSSDTQYNRATDRRRLIFHKLVRNPGSAIAGGNVKRALAQRTRDRIVELLAMLPRSIKKRDRVSAIIALCWRDNAVMQKVPSRSTVQRVLRELDMDV